MLFSICVPAYNAEKTIEDCINSVRKQNFQDYELIIVNDGSTDKTLSIINDLYESDRKVRIVNQENKGLFAARMKGIAEASGDYIINLDADDWLHVDALKIIALKIKRYSPDIVLYNHSEFNDRFRKDFYFFDKDEDRVWKKGGLDEVYHAYLDGRISSICMKAIKRTLFRFENFIDYPRLSFSEDWIHSFYPMKTAECIVYIPNLLYMQRIDSNSMTRSFDPSIKLSLQIVHALRNDSFFEDKYGEEPDIWYLKAISKSILYYRCAIRDESVYLDYLRNLSRDQKLKKMYKAKNNKLSLVYKMPLQLLFRNKYKMLMRMKYIVSGIRVNE